MDNLPKTLDETFDYLNNMTSDDKEWLKLDVDEALSMAHMGMGIWLRNTLKLWETVSELRDWFKKRYFIDHPDDISSLILINYHQRKNGLKPNIIPYVDKYHKHWSKYIKFYNIKLRRFKLHNLINEITNEKK